MEGGEWRRGKWTYVTISYIRRAISEICSSSCQARKFKQAKSAHQPLIIYTLRMKLTRKSRNYYKAGTQVQLTLLRTLLAIISNLQDIKWKLTPKRNQQTRTPRQLPRSKQRTHMIQRKLFQFSHNRSTRRRILFGIGVGAIG